MKKVMSLSLSPFQKDDVSTRNNDRKTNRYIDHWIHSPYKWVNQLLVIKASIWLWTTFRPILAPSIIHRSGTRIGLLPYKVSTNIFLWLFHGFKNEHKKTSTWYLQPWRSNLRRFNRTFYKCINTIIAPQALYGVVKTFIMYLYYK